MKKICETNLKIGTKASIIMSVIIIIMGVVLVSFIMRTVTSTFQKSTIDNLTSQTQTVIANLNILDESMTYRAQSIFNDFKQDMKGEFRIDPVKTVLIGEKETPLMTLNGKQVNLDFTVVDILSEHLGGVATVFARKGDDYIRITTSLKKEDGKTRAMGTLLDNKHPAYELIKEGKTYIGRATLFGKDYMTKYEPIKSGNDIIGILFIGVDFTPLMQSLKEEIKKVKLGKTGYIYILDKKGIPVLHPSLEGKNIYEAKDATGRLFIKEILEKKKGTILYPWQNKDEKTPRDKIVAYDTFEKWGWTVGSGSYMDEFTDALKPIKNEVMLLTCIILIATVFIVFFMIKKMIVTPLKNVTEVMKKLASGDFLSKFNITSKDEIGCMVEVMNEMIASFNKMINDVIVESNKVSASSDSVRSNIKYITNELREQSEQAHIIATSSNEMSATSLDVSKNCHEAANSARIANETAQSGSIAVSKTVANMTKIAEKVKSTASTIEKLGVRSDQIGAIVGTIEDIADQTNLLALNAAIEAARAGDQGRGFAVVADEVRALAERTTKATKEIGEMIKAIQKETKIAVILMEESVKDVSARAEDAANSGKSLEEILREITEVMNQVNQIATAAEEQTATTMEITSGIERTSEKSREMETMSDEITTKVVDLINVADNLRNATAIFKIESNKLLILERSKTDHRNFVNRIELCLEGKEKIEPNSLPDHHNCRFGKWYDSEGKDNCGHTNAYRGINDPHEKIHRLAKEAVSLYNNGNKEKANQILEEIENLSHVIVDQLEKMKNECTL